MSTTEYNIIHNDKASIELLSNKSNDKYISDDVQIKIAEQKVYAQLREFEPVTYAGTRWEIYVREKHYGLNKPGDYYCKITTPEYVYRFNHVRLLWMSEYITFSIFVPPQDVSKHKTQNPTSKKQ